MTEKALQGAAVEVALVQAAKADAEKNKHQLESICRTLQVRASAIIALTWMMTCLLIFALLCTVGEEFSTEGGGIIFISSCCFYVYCVNPRHSPFLSQAELSHRREAERQEINRKFNASLDDMRQKLEKQRLLYQEQV